MLQLWLFESDLKWFQWTVPPPFNIFHSRKKYNSRNIYSKFNIHPCEVVMAQKPWSWPILQIKSENTCFWPYICHFSDFIKIQQICNSNLNHFQQLLYTLLVVLSDTRNLITPFPNSSPNISASGREIRNYLYF